MIGIPQIIVEEAHSITLGGVCNFVVLKMAWDDGHTGFAVLDHDAARRLAKDIDAVLAPKSERVDG
jgi:hypothetical protein